MLPSAAATAGATCPFSSGGYAGLQRLLPRSTLGVAGVAGKLPSLAFRECHFLSPMREAHPFGSPFIRKSQVAETAADAVPVPIVVIDQETDPNATIVIVSFGNRLGALLDTMQALRDLGLEVTKGSVTTTASLKNTKFFIMQNGRKVENPSVLEAIRLSIINNLLKFHPESSEKLAMGEFFGVQPPAKLDVELTTKVIIKDVGPKRSLLYIETPDRPGLLVNIIDVVTSMNIEVESAEIDTEGLLVKDKFYVHYGGAALDESSARMLTNALRFYLMKEEDSSF